MAGKVPAQVRHERQGVVAMVGVGWCILTGRECPFSEGHGPDGKVKCSCEGECPEMEETVIEEEA